MTVLVITEPLDVTADLVITRLTARGVRVHRFDTADFPQTLTVAAEVGGHGQWSGMLTDVYRATGLGGVSAAYFRRPAPFCLPATLDAYERRWADHESRMGLGGLPIAAAIADTLERPS